MFGFFKKKEKPIQLFTIKSEIELKHKDGNIVKVTVEGLSEEQVSYVSNRIKETFYLKTPQNNINKNMEKFWDQMSKNWEKQEEIFDSIFKDFDKKK